MKRLTITTFIFLCLFVSTHCQADQPNVLLVYLDDFGWRDTSYMGSDFYETPHLDKLASAGIVFDEAYSCAANCAPARACLLSGQYTPRHKIYNVGTRPRGKAQFRRLEHVAGVSTLDPKISTWAHQIQKAGYKTATMGKWHLSDDPIPYGFDVNIGGTHSGGPPRGYYPPHGKAPGLGKAPKGEYLTDRLSDEAIKFIETNKERPWLLYLTHFAVHTPLHAKKELVEKYQNKKKGKLHNHVAMATMIQSVDDGIGKICAKLKELGLYENTVIIFYSDNGGYGPATDMAPLKGYKGTYYEGGIRVPFFVHWPEAMKSWKEKNSSASNAKQIKATIPMIGVDLYPTLCEITGAKRPKDQVLDGISLVPYLKGEVENVKKLEERLLYWHFPAYLQSYQGVHDEQRDPLFRSRPCSIIRKGPWKLHYYYEDKKVELYNLRDDPAEKNDLSNQSLQINLELKMRLFKWLEETGADLPKAKNPKFDAQAEAKAIANKQGKK